MTIRVTTAAQLIAELRARKAVKDELRSRGQKVTHYTRRKISILAKQWLDVHRGELVEECLAEARTHFS